VHRGLITRAEAPAGERGNNIYSVAILAFLDSLREEERGAWVAMETIKTLRELGGYLVCAVQATQARGRSVGQTSFLSWASLDVHFLGWKTWWSAS
jgi:hypothetical protein